jgi:hypothetical protein
MEQITLRRIGGTLYLRVPAGFVHKKNLNHGDSLFWIPREDTVTLRLIRPELLAEICEAKTVEAT